MRLKIPTLAAVAALAVLLGPSLPRCVAHPLPEESNPDSYLFHLGDSDTQIVAQIKQAVPALNDPTMRDFEKIRKVRRWLSQLIPGADAASGLDLPGRFNLDHNAASTIQMLVWCERREAGMQCGGGAVLAYRVYRLLGYEAVVINFGDAATGASHVTTLVKLRDRSTALWTIQDVSYNFTFFGMAGQPLGFHELVDLLVTGRQDEIRLYQPDGVPAIALYPTEVDPRKVESLKGLSAKLLKHYDGYAAYQIRVSFRDTFEKIPAVSDLLKRHFPNADPLWLFLMPLSCSGEQDALALMDYARQARARHALIASSPPSAPDRD